MASVALSSADLAAARSKPSSVRSDTLPCTHSLFQQPWWLDAIAPGAWDAVTIVKAGKVIGRLPFVRKRLLGLTILTQPLLTQFLGPWIETADGKPQNRLAHEHQVLAGLVDELPPHDVFLQHCHHSVTNCLAFYWHGFTLSNSYTYVLDDLNDHDKIWAGLRENIRREIRKAERQVSIRPVEDIGTVIALNRMTYERQGMSAPYSTDTVRRLDAACRERGVRRILVAEGADGIAHAAVYLVWDGTSAYYLMGGGDPRLRTSGAMSLLMWEAIKFAGQVARRFDFEGSMLRPVERFFRAFGARQVPYARLTRGATLLGELALLAHEWRSARRRRSANG